METISSHIVKYRTEKYFKNKLIKNFGYFWSWEREVNLNAPPTGIKLQALFHFSFQLSQRRAYNLKIWPQKPCCKILQGAQFVFVEVRGHAEMNVLSIFTMGPSLLGRSGGMLPQKILKIRYHRLSKIYFSTWKMRQNSIMQPTYLHKSGPKTHHAWSLFHEYTPEE